MPISIRPLTEELVQRLVAAPSKPHRHGFQEIVLLTAGGGSHLIDGERQSLEAPMAILIARGKQHQLLPRPGSAGWIINFQEDQLPGYASWVFSHFFAISSVDLGAGQDCHRILRLALLIAELQDAGGQDAEEARMHLLLAMLHLLQIEVQAIALQRSVATSAEFRLFLRFLEVLDQNFQSEREISFYARALHTTGRRLAGLSRAFLGKTTLQLIEDRCISEARRRLVQTDLPIKQIAADLGYLDHSYFTKVFRKATGERPSTFRQTRQGCTG